MIFDPSFTVPNRMALCVRKFTGHGILAVSLPGPSFYSKFKASLFLCYVPLPSLHPSSLAAEPFPPAPLARPQHTSCLSLSALGLFGEIKN